MCNLYFKNKTVGKSYFYFLVVIDLPRRGGGFFFNKFVRIEILKHIKIFM